MAMPCVLEWRRMDCGTDGNEEERLAGNQARSCYSSAKMDTVPQVSRPRLCGDMVGGW